MKFTYSLLLSAAFFGLLACSDAEKKEDTANGLNIAPATTQAGAPAAGNVALNPAHGMPGHRCDIQVGAPLNSPAAPNLPMPNLQPLPAQPVQTIQPTNGTVAPGTNPAHGQPGHDCSIPVGAPLNK